MLQRIFPAWATNGPPGSYSELFLYFSHKLFPFKYDQTEQEQLLGQIQALETAMQEVKDNQQNAVRWAELMAQYVGIQELTAENLNLLVERIEVYDRTETNAGAEQMIKICYRFGGYIRERVFPAKVLKHPCRKNACPLKERKGYGKISLVS